jgi:hypothetical protein
MAGNGEVTVNGHEKARRWLSYMEVTKMKTMKGWNESGIDLGIIYMSR